ncbi:carboxymuconolactone decarboxylase family protein [Desulforamulus hydrothermalis]|nr:carboxymuconolactone decarboxylase family protein [Desulforamulus hydrothermalis]
MDLTKILQRLQEEKPAVAAAIGDLRQAVLMNSSLDDKTANLIAVGIATALRNPDALRGHLKLARAAGANRDEAIGAVLMAIPGGGVPAALAALPEVWELYDA